MRRTFCLNRASSLGVSVSAFAITGTIFTRSCSAFMNAMSSSFSLKRRHCITKRHGTNAEYPVFDLPMSGWSDEVEAEVDACVLDFCRALNFCLFRKVLSVLLIHEVDDRFPTEKQDNDKMELPAP